MDSLFHNAHDIYKSYLAFSQSRERTVIAVFTANI